MLTSYSNNFSGISGLVGKGIIGLLGKEALGDVIARIGS